MSSLPEERSSEASKPSEDGIIGTLAKGLKDVNTGPLTWQMLVLTPDRVMYLWEQLRQFPIMFDDFSRDNQEMFFAQLTNPKNIFVDIGPGLGLAAGFAVRPKLDAVLHLAMFDRRLRGREDLFKDIMQYFFDHLQLRRMTAMITEDAITAVKLVERLGFQEEGLMRYAVLRDGKYLNVRVYGILREEL